MLFSLSVCRITQKLWTNFDEVFQRDRMNDYHQQLGRFDGDPGYDADTEFYRIFLTLL